MKVIPTAIPDVKLIEPRVFRDDRGFFLESYNARDYRDNAAISSAFVQDNHTRSHKGVVRGLHYQIMKPQGKLVRVVHGEIYDVAVDLRKDSPTFGRWVAAHLSGENKKQIWIPIGFAHGFMVMSDSAEVLYKSTDYYHPEGERSLLWNDPDVGIDWPPQDNITLSEKDLTAVPLKDADCFD